MEMNTTYLNEILLEEGSDFGNINSSISKIKEHANMLKKDVTTILENQSFHFHSTVNENARLKLQAENLLKKINLSDDKIENEVKDELNNCKTELECLSYSLKEITMFLYILNQLIEINCLLINAKKNFESEKFYECAQLIKTLQNIVKSNSIKLKKVVVFQKLSQEVTELHDLMYQKINEVWCNCINFKTKKKNVAGNKEHEVLLSMKNDATTKLSAIINASYHLNSNLNEKKFSTTLLHDFIIPIITKKTNVVIKTENESAMFVLNIYETGGKPDHIEVIENIKQLITFIKNNFQINIENKILFLSLLGSYIATDISDCLIKNYLSEIIPINPTEFNTYKKIVNALIDFESYLQNIEFLSKESSLIKEYAKNIRALFANKFCQSFLSKARIIMKKDIHDTIMSEEVISNINILPSYKTTLQNVMLNQEEVFLFPKSLISKHAKEIIDLLHAIVTEMEKNIGLCDLQLFYTARNIFEMYCAVAPLYHKKFLETLPQQVAIFHNNCLYFAHHLIHIVTKLKPKFPKKLKSHFCIFLEQAVILKKLAAEKFEFSVMNQRNQLIYILRDSGLATLREDTKLDSNTEKSLRKCMRQLQILQKVWSEVLFVNVYNKAMGFLIDAVVEELILLIISVEDISSQTASDLVFNFTILLERVPSLFANEKEINVHVKSWPKFKEFILILKGTLRDIDERWANGLGPLAMEFTPEQIKHLIRALFQNSNKRAALLAKISNKKR